MRTILLNLAGVMVMLVLAGTVYAQDVTWHPDPSEPLTERWTWASTATGGACAQGCWIGYGVQRMMHVDSYTGWNTDGRGEQSTLQALIYGREVEAPPSRHETRTKARRGRSNGSSMVLKELALLFRIEGGGRTIRDVRISNISLPAALDGLPLVWLGRAAQAASLELLKKEFAQASGNDLKEELVAAIGMHDSDDLVVPFLSKIVASKDDEDIRSQAVFWLAETGAGDVLPLLERIARDDSSKEVREQAVFGISRIETEEADELLISLARKLADRPTREQAIFWLGQKASKKAAENLEEIVDNDPDLEIRKKAVFAISQLPADEGIPRLIRIARTHRSAAVRHDAIFWLGESGDERAVDVLVQIVRGE